MNKVNPPQQTTKIRTEVDLTASLVDTAHRMNINLSTTLDTLLAQAIEMKKREQQQEKEDRKAINQFKRKTGMFADDDVFGGL